MKKQGINIGSLKMLFVLTVVVLMFILTGCSKEEFSILNVPLNELESSYYELGDRTIELDQHDLEQLIIEKSDFGLTLTNDDRFDALEVGSILISSLEVPYEDCVLREIVSIERNEGAIKLITKPGSILKAYKRYRIDSELPNIVQVREESFVSITPFFAALDNTLDDAFSAFKEAGIISILIASDIKLEGQIGWIAEHPNDVYVLNSLCEGGVDCEYDEDEMIDSNDNGVYDVVEQYFQSNFIDSLIDDGFFTMKITDFKIKKLELSVGKSYKIEDKPKSIYDEIKNISKDVTNEKDDSGYNLKYVILPGLNVGVFGANFAWGPIASAVINAGVAIKPSLSESTKMDIILANYKNGEGITSLEPTFEFRKDGNAYSMTDFIKTGRTDLGIAFSGSFQGKLGIALGLAITVGEANTAGVSFGATFETGFYFGVNGDIGGRVIDLFSINGPVNYDLYATLCVDAGIFYDFILFTDANLAVSSIPDKLDVKVKFPKSAFGFNNVGFGAILPEPKVGNVTVSASSGICIELDNECTAIVADSLLVSSVNVNNLTTITTKFNFNNPNNIGGSYKVKLKHLEGEIGLSPNEEIYFYGETYTVSIQDPDQNVDKAYLKNELKIIIEDQSFDCAKELGKDKINYFINCDDINSVEYEFIGVVDSGIKTIVNFLGESINFFTFEKATSYCNDLQTRLMSREEIESYLSNRCINPNGYTLTNGKHIDKNKIALWMLPDDEAQNNFITYDIIVEPGSGRTIGNQDVSKKPSQSVFAPCLCAF